MVDESLHTLQESDRMRQGGVRLERGLIHPARMHIEQPRIADRAKMLNGPAPRLFTSGTKNVAEGGSDGILLPLFRVKAGENEELKFHRHG